MQTPHLYEDVIKQTFLEVFNSLLDIKDEILEGYKEILDWKIQGNGYTRRAGLNAGFARFFLIWV